MVIQRRGHEENFEPQKAPIFLTDGKSVSNRNSDRSLGKAQKYVIRRTKSPRIGHEKEEMRLIFLLLVFIFLGVESKSFAQTLLDKLDFGGSNTRNGGEFNSQGCLFNQDNVLYSLRGSTTFFYDLVIFFVTPKFQNRKYFSSGHVIRFFFLFPLIKCYEFRLFREMLF